MAFEAFLTYDKSLPKKGRRVTYTASLGLHVVLLVAGVVYSFWHVDELSPPTVTVTFMTAAPPPPPPPPPPKKKSSTSKPKTKPVEIVQPKPNEIVQPKEEKKEEPEEEEEGAEEGGQEGGVKGGVVGGVIGGVVGGVVGSTGSTDNAPPRFVAPNVAKGQLAIDPQADQHRVKLPPALSRADMMMWAMVKICVSKEGNVTDVKIIRGADPTVDPEIKVKLRTWRYKPYAVDGRPVPFCTNVRYEISTR